EQRAEHEAKLQELDKQQQQQQQQQQRNGSREEDQTSDKLGIQKALEEQQSQHQLSLQRALEERKMLSREGSWRSNKRNTRRRFSMRLRRAACRARSQVAGDGQATAAAAAQWQSRGRPDFRQSRHSEGT
ncbi:unnamed protein product, partial [Effrenium voratum]